MSEPVILCVGSVLWDVIGRAPYAMTLGADMPGKISRIPGGVALNIAMTLKQFGREPALLSVVGRDAEGDALVTACETMGLITQFLHRSETLPTDIYMAIECESGLVGAIADADSLERSGDKILESLENGVLGSARNPYTGQVVLDGNLTQSLLHDISMSALFAAADLRIAPASPGKAARIKPFLRCGHATLYVNKTEAEILADIPFPDAGSAAAALGPLGARRVLVTDGAAHAAIYEQGHVHTAPPGIVTDVQRLTGAGDTFMAAHIAAEAKGLTGQTALDAAMRAAAKYVSGASPV